MSFFLKKQEVEIEPFLRLFYENVILNCIVDGVDINAKIFDTLKNALVATDSNFTNIDSQKFNNEIIALQFELYALAWLHQFGNKVAYGYAQILDKSSGNSAFVQDVFQSISLAVAQSVFTKNYLNKKNLNDIWEAMESYNQAIARSTIIGRTPKKAFDKVYLAKVNLSRANLFDLYHEKGLDNKSVARVLNRLFSDEVWKKGITAGLLLFALCDRLGFGKDFEPSKESHRRWFIEINDFYEKGRGSLSKVKIKG